jgi:hypothetical protein
MTDDELSGMEQFYLAKGEGNCEDVLTLIADLRAARVDLADLQSTFDRMWDADQRAIMRWQEAHPGNDMVWPDRSRLTEWLLERAFPPNRSRVVQDHRPVKPTPQMTTEELIAEWHRWDDEIRNATGWGAALAAANEARRDVENKLAQRGLVRGVD